MAVPITQNIAEIVHQNYVFGFVLHYFGIHFYKYSEQSLEEVCKAKGLDIKQVVRELEACQNQQQTPPINQYPIDVILQYLRHTHYIFINERLPYIAQLIEDLEANNSQRELIQDLKLLFPLFVEEFIHHIHAEEDTLFTYIQTLHRASLGQYSPSKLYYEMEENSIAYFAYEHHTQDDEMQGIREITNNYNLPASANLHLRVLFAELQRLDQELEVHARIENEILFVKASKIENLVREMIRQKTASN